MPYAVGQNVMVQVSKHSYEFIWMEGVIFEAEYSETESNIYLIMTVDDKRRHFFEDHVRPFFFTRDITNNQPTALGH